MCRMDLSAFNLLDATTVAASKLQTMRGMPAKQQTTLEDAYAYAFNWDNYNAPALLQSLLKNDIHARQSTKSFAVKLRANVKPLSRVLLLCLKRTEQRVAPGATPSGNPGKRAQSRGYLNWHRPDTEGVDLGSRNIQPVEKPSVMMMTGDGVNLYEAGEA